MTRIDMTERAMQDFVDRLAVQPWEKQRDALIYRSMLLGVFKGRNVLDFGHSFDVIPDCFSADFALLELMELAQEIGAVPIIADYQRHEQFVLKCIAQCKVVLESWREWKRTLPFLDVYDRSRSVPALQVFEQLLEWDWTRMIAAWISHNWLRNVASGRMVLDLGQGRTIPDWWSASLAAQSLRELAQEMDCQDAFAYYQHWHEIASDGCAEQLVPVLSSGLISVHGIKQLLAEYQRFRSVL